MKMSKLVKTFKTYFLWDKKEVKENTVEINRMIKELYNKKQSIEDKLKECEKKNDEKKLEEKRKAIKKLIKKAKKEFI